MARGILAALRHVGYIPSVASTFCSRESKGDPDQQRELMRLAAEKIPQLIEKGRAEEWRGWVTYHNYYKAPDLIGPSICKALGIPYLQIEATRARKRLTGPWAEFAKASEKACDAAKVIFYLTDRDAEALRRDAPTGQEIMALKPFLAREDLPETSTLAGPMVAIGMMRVAAKLASYRLLAETLALLPEQDWQLQIVGDGPARREVENLFGPFQPRIEFLGELDPVEISRVMASARLLFWPGVDEAFGMVYLEAQSHGIPVVAQDRPGVRDVLAPGDYPSVEAGPEGLAALLSNTLASPAPRGREARDYVGRHHLLPAAGASLRAGLHKAGIE